MESAASSASSTSRGPSCNASIRGFFSKRPPCLLINLQRQHQYFEGRTPADSRPWDWLPLVGTTCLRRVEAMRGGVRISDGQVERQMAVRSRATRPWRWGPKSQKGSKTRQPNAGLGCVMYWPGRCNPQVPKWLSSPKREGQRGGQCRDPCPGTLILSRASHQRMSAEKV